MTSDVDVAESMVWEGTPSLRYCAFEFLACLLLCFLIIPIFYGLWIALRLKTIRYKVTTERIRVRTGILSQQWNDLELYRIKDTKLIRSFWRDRLFGLSTLLVTSGDASSPELLILGIEQSTAMNVWEEIRRNTERLRNARRTMVVEGI